MNYRLVSPAELWAWLTDNALALVIPAGAIAVVVLLVLLVRAIRRGTADTWAVAFSTLTALGFSAEGMYEVTREKLTELPISVAAVLFLVGEAAMLASMVRAHRHFHRVNPVTGEPNRNLGKHGRFVWVIALTLGFVVSLNSSNVVEYAVRLSMPVLAAGMWWMGYADDVTRTTGQATTWRWHPRRIAIALGIIEPGDGDLATVHRERHIRRMTALAHKLHTGSARFASRRAARLARLALAADADMVTEVSARVHRAHSVVTLTDPAVSSAVTTNRKPRPPRTGATVATGTTSGDDTATTPPNASRGNGRHGAGASTAVRVAKAVEKAPTATPVQIAAKLGLSERTVQRYMADPGFPHFISRDTIRDAAGDVGAAGASGTGGHVNGAVVELATAA